MAWWKYIVSPCISAKNDMGFLILSWRSRSRSYWVSKVDWKALNMELLNYPASILSFVLEETILCLPLELILGGAFGEPGGAVKGFGVVAFMSLMT